MYESYFVLGRMSPETLDVPRAIGVTIAQMVGPID